MFKSAIILTLFPKWAWQCGVKLLNGFLGHQYISHEISKVVLNKQFKSIYQLTKSVRYKYTNLGPTNYARSTNN